MRDTYFNLNECTEKELEELADKLYLDILSEEKDYSDVLSEDEIKLIYSEDKIPYSILEKVYGHISFVDEDFWCNC